MKNYGIVANPGLMFPCERELVSTLSVKHLGGY